MQWDSFSTRIKLVAIFVTIIGAGIIVRLFYLQVIHGTAFRDEADNRYQSKASDVIDRGTIYLSKKDGTLVTAATVASGFQLEIQSKTITDTSGLYDKLAPYISDQITREDFVAKILPGTNQYRVVARKLTKTQANEITALKESGAVIKVDKWRFYPGEFLAAHVLGFLGYSDKGQNGRYGIERSYEAVLSHTAESLYVNFFAEVFANIKSTVFESDQADGDLVTTIEPFVQTTLEKELADTKTKWGADGAGGIVMDPVTGEILGMAYTPGFNPNEYGKETDTAVYANPNVESVFEFGSVIKPLVMAGALDAGVVTKDTTYTDKGFVKVGDRTINNFDKIGRGPGTTMQDVLNQSLNTGMVFVEQKLGKTAFKRYLLSYQIAEKTGIDLPGEVASLTANLQGNRDVELANAAFGQGIALTPIEAIRAFSALGTGGKLPWPHVGKEIKYEFSNKTLEHEDNDLVAWKPEISEKITDMLVTVGEGVMKTYHVSVPHNRIAMKTGTAQMANLQAGGYFADKYMHSMFSYFPAYNPKFIVFMYVKNPRGPKFAAQTLASPMVDTANFLLNYYNITPDK